MRNLLSDGRKRSFAEVFSGVLLAGPAERFAVRSALNKERQRGHVEFDDGYYSRK